MEDRQHIISILREQGIIGSHRVHVVPLAGGVSSDIWLLESLDLQLVVKRALPELKVQDLWEADVRRNIAEQNFIRYLNMFSPDSVSNLIYGDAERAFLVMPFYGPPWKSWKSNLLDGVFDLGISARAARLLADIHNHSFYKSDLALKFNNKQDFFDLRIDPYLIFTGLRHGHLASIYEEEASRLMKSEIALMHGDFSPKNILVNAGEIILLDHEVACFGDPAFDLAFLINHLMLKNILFPDQFLICDQPLMVWKTYFDKIQCDEKEALKCRASRLWLMLLLARVDGKSPVEYLNEDQKDFIREFVSIHLPGDHSTNFLYLKNRYAEMLQKNERP